MFLRKWNLKRKKLKFILRWEKNYMDIKREEAFNEVIDKLDELGLLPYVMIMGSWAEILFILFFVLCK
jgi:CRISPR/Cas system-associated protein Cas10 (large subunit of type III CRISPR-Cas system)